MIRCFKDPTYVLMRVLLCKIQCPSFICFSKPSPHISLKLDNTPPVSSSSTTTTSTTTTTAVDDDDDDEHDQYDDAHVEEVDDDVDHVDDLLNEEGRPEEDCGVEEEEGHCNGEILKSSLKKEVLDSGDGERKEKKKVQWVDLIGKELAEVREFECSEDDDIRYDGDKSCVCVIL